MTPASRAALDIMKLVREHAATGSPSDYAAVRDAVDLLAIAAHPEPKPATAWAVLDAHDQVAGVERSRVVALDAAGRRDGWRVAPLVLADLDALAVSP